MTSNAQRATRNAPFPAVTCLCPTFRRPARLRDAVACFLSQDYPGEARLLILNDAPEPIALPAATPRVEVVNAPARFPTLGHKRQALLEMAQTPLVAHWDDDDLYLPWHLSSLVARLVEAGPPVACVKPRAAWFGVGPPGRWRLRGPCHNAFEGQMLFDRRRALELAGYPPLDSGQARALLDAFRRAGGLLTWEPARHELSYVYRWADGLEHVSARPAPVAGPEAPGPLS